MRRASRREEADPASVASPRLAETHTPMSTSSPALPGPVFRPNVQVFGDEMPGWPKYPEARLSDLNEDTDLPTSSVNHAARHRQATPTISTIAPRASPHAHLWDTPFVYTGNPPLLSASPPSVSQVAPPDIDICLHGSFGINTDTHSITCQSVTPVTAAGNPPISIVSMPAAVQGVCSAASQATPSASPSHSSSWGYQLRGSQIEEVLGENSAAGVLDVPVT